MTKTQVEKRIKKILMEQMGHEPDEVKLDQDLIEDLGADSLDIVELVMAAEEEFNIEIPDEATEEIDDMKVGSWIDYIHGRVSNE